MKEEKIMSIVRIKKSIARYMERHGAELICSLAMLDGNMDFLGAYLEDYLCASRQA